MEIVIGIVAAVVFFLVVSKMIRPSRQKGDETSYFICDVCKDNVCECRPDDGRSDS